MTMELKLKSSIYRPGKLFLLGVDQICFFIIHESNVKIMISCQSENFPHLRVLDCDPEKNILDIQNFDKKF